MDGSLPGSCANLAFPYIPMQNMNAQRYDAADALAIARQRQTVKKSWAAKRRKS